MLGSCLVSFHFLWAILCPQAVMRKASNKEQHRHRNSGTYLGIPQRGALFRAGVLMLQYVGRSRRGGKVTMVGEPSLAARAFRHEDGKLAIVAAAKVPSRPESASVIFIGFRTIH